MSKVSPIRKYTFCSICAGFLIIITALIFAAWLDLRKTSQLQLDLDHDQYVVPDSLAEACEAYQFTVQRDGRPDYMFDYRLFRPVGSSNGSKYPLIVWMHGHGAYELNFPNLGQLKGIGELVLRDLDRLEAYQFYLVAVQCPKNLQWDSDIDSYDSVDATIMIIEQLERRFPIDPTRVSVIGISSGGPACFEIVRSRPDLFAAAAPLACSSWPSGNLHDFTEVPIWAFRSTADTVPPMSDVRSIFRQMRNLGASCLLTEVDTGTHDSWTTAFLDYDLLGWLLAQHLGRENCPAPGALSAAARFRILVQSGLHLTTWWPQFAVVVIASIISWAGLREYNKRSLLRRSVQSTSSLISSDARTNR